LIITFEFKSD